MSSERNGGGIPWGAIVVAFIFAWPIGLGLLIFKLLSSGGAKASSQRNGNRTYSRPSGTASQYTQRGDWRANAQDAEVSGAADGTGARKVRQEGNVERNVQSGASAGRTYSPGMQQGPEPEPKTAPKAAPAKQPRASNYNYAGATQRKQTTAAAARAASGLSRRLYDKLYHNAGKGLAIAGWITVGAGAFSAAMTFLGVMMDIGMMTAVLYSSVVAASVCIPGFALALPGISLSARANRCQTYYNMITSRRIADIVQMAAAVPTSYSTACKDLRWMIREGFFPGAYIDASRRCIVFHDTEPEEKPQQQVKKAEPGAKGGFAEVAQIRALNDSIADEFVSERMERIEELTQKILTYVSDHPEKEDRIRQFRNHYLPKTMKILESYARFERQGVEGDNIRSAMKDVEEIMDTLVNGFEKQLDMLFDDEAMNVAADVNVLDSMMGLQGLKSDDPFRIEPLSYGEEK